MGANSHRTFCFDLDGTLCTNTWGDYEAARPFAWAIERLNALARAGHRIIVFTARGGTTGIDWRERTEAQLRSWGVRYDELVLGKPTADIYVDDRTVHVDAWRYGDARTATSGGMPVLPPPRSSTVVEVGRTFGGALFRPEAHARRVLASTAGHGVASSQTVEEIVEAVELAVEASRELLVPGDEVVYTVGLSGLPHAAYLDTLDGGAAPGLTIGCRLLSQVAEGLERYLRDGGIAAATGGSALEKMWPLAVGAEGELRDLLGGEPVVVRGRTLAVRTEDPPVALAATLALAAELGLTVDPAEPTLGDARSADELLLVGMPFCVLPVASLDGAALGRAAPGSVAAELLRAWEQLTGASLGVGRG